MDGKQTIAWIRRTPKCFTLTIPVDAFRESDEEYEIYAKKKEVENAKQPVTTEEVV